MITICRCIQIKTLNRECRECYHMDLYIILHHFSDLNVHDHTEWFILYVVNLVSTFMSAFHCFERKENGSKYSLALISILDHLYVTAKQKVEIRRAQISRLTQLNAERPSGSFGCRFSGVLSKLEILALETRGCVTRN